MGASTPRRIREAVRAVKDIKEETRGKEAVSLPELAKKMRLDKATVCRRVKEAIDRGYLVKISKVGQGFRQKWSSVIQWQMIREYCRRLRPAKSFWRRGTGVENRIRFPFGGSQELSGPYTLGRPVTPGGRRNYSLLPG